jgi:hypothetical protein
VWTWHVDRAMKPSARVSHGCLRCGKPVRAAERTFCSRRCNVLWLEDRGPAGDALRGRRYEWPGFDPEEDAFYGYEPDDPLDADGHVWVREWHRPSWMRRQDRVPSWQLERL